jgi:hypothetical protein
MFFAVLFGDKLTTASSNPLSLTGGGGEASSSAYYRRCADAHAARAAPLHIGEPGYREELDRDGDGVACEPYRGY